MAVIRERISARPIDPLAIVLLELVKYPSATAIISCRKRRLISSAAPASRIVPIMATCPASGSANICL